MRILYSMEFSGQSAEEAADGYWAEHKVSDETREFIMNIVAGVAKLRETLDTCIAGASKNWPVHRMAPIDRAIVRMAAYELKETDLAAAIIVNEAVEIAKKYAAPDSPSFINGILGKIVEQTRGTETAQKPRKVKKKP